MNCCKERDKKHWFQKLCMQWTELVAVGFTAYPNNIFFSLINVTHMERMNKATLLINLLFFGTKKEEIHQNP